MMLEQFLKWIFSFAIAVLISNFSVLAFMTIVTLYIILEEKGEEIRQLENKLKNRGGVS